MCCINCICNIVYYNIDTRLTYTLTCFNIYFIWTVLQIALAGNALQKRVVYKRNNFPISNTRLVDFSEIDLPVLGSAAIYLQQCFKLPHPVTRAVYYVIQSYCQNNTWLLGWSLRVCSNFIGWFIDTGPIAPTMSLKWLIGYNCFNPMEAIESSQTLDLHWWLGHQWPRFCGRPPGYCRLQL